MKNNYILPQTETDRVEFKTSFTVAVIETLVAFANTKGGTVYVGVTDVGKAVGVTLSTESVQQWVNAIKSKTEPSLTSIPLRVLSPKRERKWTKRCLPMLIS